MCVSLCVCVRACVLEVVKLARQTRWSRGLPALMEIELAPAYTKTVNKNLQGKTFSCCVCSM